MATRYANFSDVENLKMKKIEKNGGYKKNAKVSRKLIMANYLHLFKTAFVAYHDNSEIKRFTVYKVPEN